VIVPITAITIRHAGVAEPPVVVMECATYQEAIEEHDRLRAAQPEFTFGIIYYDKDVRNVAASKKRRQRTVRFPRQSMQDITNQITLDHLAGDALDLWRKGLDTLNPMRVMLGQYAPERGVISVKLRRGWTLVVPYGPGPDGEWIKRYRAAAHDPSLNAPMALLSVKRNWHWYRACEVVTFLQQRDWTSDAIPEAIRAIEQARRELIRHTEEATRWL
jgi:hypothetical protein